MLMILCTNPILVGTVELCMRQSGKETGPAIQQDHNRMQRPPYLTRQTVKILSYLSLK